MNNTNPRSRRAARRKKAAAPLGMTVFVLAGVGLAAVAFAVVGMVRGLLDDSDKMAQYESFIRPVVMMDPVPFKGIENVEEGMLLQSSLWAVLLGEGRSGYSYDDAGLLLVPSSDVDVAAATLFGPSVKLTHQTFDDYDASYLFDPELSVYRVPVVAKVAYSPKVESIAKDGADGLILTVGYVAPGNIWTTGTKASQTEPTPDKYLYYDLAKWDKGYYIKSVRDIDENAPPRS